MAVTQEGPLALYLPPAGSDPVIIVCTKEQHTKPVTFTSHPVEQGSPVTDHARPEPLAVNLECVASKTPLSGNGYTSAADLWQALSNLQATPALIKAVTIGGVYDSMGVESVSRPIDVQSANAVRFTLQLRQIRVVRNKFTRVVVAADPRAQGNKKKGGAQTKPLSEADNRTPLAKLVDGLAGHKVAP